VGLVEKFDALLCLLDFLEADVSSLVLDPGLAVDILNHILESDGNDFSRLTHLGLELVLGDLFRDVSHVDVGLEGLLHLLVNLALILVLLVVVCGDKFRDENNFAFYLFFRV